MSVREKIAKRERTDIREKIAERTKIDKKGIIGSKYGFDFLSNDEKTSKSLESKPIKEEAKPKKIRPLQRVIIFLIKLFFGFRYIIYYIVDNPKSLISKLYNIFIALVALISVMPLFFAPGTTNTVIDWVSTNYQIFAIVFISDYLARWFLADFKIKKGFKSFLIYPFTVWGIIDLLGIIPFLAFSKGYPILRIFATFRLFKIVRIFPKLADGFGVIIYSVIKKWRIFVVILITLVFFVIIGGIVIFQIEGPTNDSINTYWDAVWFVFISITTIGYGDIYPITELGRIFTILFSLVGIGIISIVTAIFASGFSELDRLDEEIEKEQQFSEDNYILWYQNDSKINVSLKLEEELNHKHHSHNHVNLDLKEELNNIDYNLLTVFRFDEDDNLIETNIKFK